MQSKKRYFYKLCTVHIISYFSISDKLQVYRNDTTTHCPLNVRILYVSQRVVFSAAIDGSNSSLDNIFLTNQLQNLHYFYFFIRIRLSLTNKKIG